MDRELLGALARMIILLPLVCVLAYLTVRFGFGRTRKFNPYGAGKRMRVLEQVSMGPKCGLSLVQVGNRYLLFAHQEHTIVLVRESDHPPALIEEAMQGWPGMNRVVDGIRFRYHREGNINRPRDKRNDKAGES